jgi:hypothetical protein
VAITGQIRAGAVQRWSVAIVALVFLAGIAIVPVCSAYAMCAGMSCCASESGSANPTVFATAPSCATECATAQTQPAEQRTGVVASSVTSHSRALAVVTEYPQAAAASPPLAQLASSSWTQYPAGHPLHVVNSVFRI